MRLNIDDVQNADDETKKKFILELQGYMHDRSFTKSEVLISELISILDISHHFGKEHSNLTDAQISHIKNYIEKEAATSIQIAQAEAIELINLYFKNTKNAHDLGISEEAISKTTRRALYALKYTLLESAKTIEERYNLRTNMNILQNKMKETLELGDILQSEEIQQQISMVYAVSGYKRRIEELYDELESTFVEGIMKKLKKDEQNEPTKGIAKYTEVMTREIFDRIQRTFSAFQKQILES